MIAMICVSVQVETGKVKIAPFSLNCLKYGLVVLEP